MVQIEGMVGVEEGVVAVVAMVEMVHGIDRTEAMVAQFVYKLGFVVYNIRRIWVWLQCLLLLYLAPLPRHIHIDF